MKLNHEIEQCLKQITQTEGNTEALVEALKRLDEIAKSTDLPKQLVHFLQKRSYEKALLYLQGSAKIPKGICGEKGHKGNGA